MFGQDCPDEMDGYYCTTDLNVLQSFLDLNDCINMVKTYLENGFL